MLLMPASAAGVVAPAHATVVSTFEKLTTPGIDALVTGVWANATEAVSARTAVRSDLRITELLDAGAEREAMLLGAIDGDDASRDHVGVADEVRRQFFVDRVRRGACSLGEHAGEERRGHVADGEVHAALHHLGNRGAQIRQPFDTGRGED